MGSRAGLLLLFVLGVCSAHQVNIHNRCSFDVWVGILGSTIPDGGGYKLSPGQSRSSYLPNHWSGRFWGRTHCGSNGHCETGDCGYKIACGGAGGVPPVTLAEITFDTGGSNTLDFYDVSLVDGYNLQMSMRPVSGYRRGGGGTYDCTRAGCNYDLNNNCPSELRIYGTGGTIACKSACLAFNRDDFCCRGSHNVPATCPPFSYSRIFKSACPAAYSYAYDDQKSTFTCNGNSPGSSNYDITFCG